MVFLELGQGMHANIIGKMIFPKERGEWCKMYDMR
jgi:hypothetical protein